MAKRRPAQTSGHPPVTARRHSSTHPLWICLVLVVLNLFVFARVGGFEFVNWDDPSYITENIHVQQGLSWSTVRWALTTAHSPYWHPLTWLSHLLDVSLFGLDPGGHHLTNLLLHIVNSLLLFGLLRRLTGHEWRSAFVAAIFAVHPLHVESVAWVTERKDVLSTCFLLLTIGAYSSYVRKPSRGRYAVMSVLFVLALMSKPMVVTLPVLLLLLDIWPLGRVGAGSERAVWGWLLVEKIPVLVLAAATSVATVMVQRRVGAMASLAALSWTARLSNAIVGYGEYVWKTIWPANLAAFYPFRDYPVPLVVAVAVALGAVTIVAVALRQRTPALLVGWLWFVIALLPVTGLLQAGEQRIADRFMYVPMIGLLMILTWGLPALFEQSDDRERARSRAVLAVASTLVVLACAVAARAQTAHWRTSVDLWRHAVLATPESYIAYENLAQALRERGELEESRAMYERALSVAPAHSPAYVAVIQNSLGLVLTREGRPQDARARFEAAVAANPAFAEPHGNLGNALAAEGKYADAVEHYRIAIKLKPDFTEAQLGLGSALLSQGDAAEAIGHYREALKLDPSLAQAHNGLGASLAREGRDDEAMAEYEEALRLKPDLTTAHFNLAMLLVKRGRLADARRHAETALTIDPQYEPAHRLWLWLRTQGEGGG
jgi:protein O-mannosyl-transferase